MNLYPLKFEPIFKERIWGGNRLETILGKDLGGNSQIGESWELSAVDDNISVVRNGFLAGNDLQDVIEIYMGEVVGDKVFEQYGIEFPILIKFIDANDDLSIQVHPNDEIAEERHNARGKTEMWFALDDTQAPKLITGFKQDTNKEQFLNKLQDNSLTELFNYEQVKKGDVFFVPAGRVHAICSGNLVAEIQQTSDITYRIYDYNRTDHQGQPRELHLDLSLDVMDYHQVKDPKVNYNPEINHPVKLAACNYFTTNLLWIDQAIQRDYYRFDSFVILMGVEGMIQISGSDFESETLIKGETILIPAALSSLVLTPLTRDARLLEVYID